ncbi:MAG TPA: LysR family transcriptional regulator [Burkholderiaceae bacterium]|nr:LysR family transcriptional regulator [Burkholderiaceae bacterium]
MTIHKLRALEYLVAAVDERGFAAAARRLGVATPSVHRLINALEAEVGVALLHRDGASLRPTPEGAGYVERARRLLKDAAELDASLRDAGRAPTGTLIIAHQSVVARFVLPEVLPSFHAAFPGVRVDLRDAGTVRDLVRLGADMLLMFGWPPAQDAVVRTIAYTRWLIVAAPSFWARYGTPREPADLARMPCALFRTPYGEVLNRWTFVRDGERVEVEVDGWLTGDDRGALDAPLLAGRIAGRWNDLTVRDSLRDGRLQPVLLDWEGQHSPPLTLLLRKSLIRQPRARAFIRHLQTTIDALTSERLPPGLPPAPVPVRPGWFRKRAG